MISSRCRVPPASSGSSRSALAYLRPQGPAVVVVSGLDGASRLVFRARDLSTIAPSSSSPLLRRPLLASSGALTLTTRTFTTLPVNFFSPSHQHQLPSSQRRRLPLLPTVIAHQPRLPLVRGFALDVASATAAAPPPPPVPQKPETPVEKAIRECKEENEEELKKAAQTQAQAQAQAQAPAEGAPAQPRPASVDPLAAVAGRPQPVAPPTVPPTATLPTPTSTMEILGAPATTTPAAAAAAIASPTASALDAKPAEKKKSLWERAKAEALHYWHGTKLLGAEISVSSRLLRKLLRGQQLTRRESRQLKRTVADVVRVVPLIVIVAIPFMELALPFLLYLFPNMLPSTFESKYQEEEKKKKLLKVRLEMAKFLQDTVEDMTVTGTSKAAAAKEFSDFFKRYRASGSQAPTDEIIKVAKKFENEITLNSLSRPQLVSMARYININAFGTDTFLRHQIENRLQYLKQDDLLIQKEGVESLSLPELQQICQSRGIRISGVSPARLKSELTQWLDLHLTYKVPSSLLILSRAFTISEKIPLTSDEALKGSAEALQATLSSLPDQVVQEAQLHVSDAAGVATYQQKLNVLQQQEELIADELEQEAESSDSHEPKTHDEEISEGELKRLGEALQTITTSSAFQDVKAELDNLKEERREYIEDIDELSQLTQKAPSKATFRISSRVDKMIQRLEAELTKADSEIGSKLALLRPDEDGRLTLADLEEGLKVIRDHPDDERIKKVVQRLDIDGDGIVSMAEIMALIKAREKEGTGVVIVKDGSGHALIAPVPAGAVPPADAKGETKEAAATASASPTAPPAAGAPPSA